MRITATDTMMRVAIMIREVERELSMLVGFSDDDLRNDHLTSHVDAVKKDLQNASARMSSAIMAARLSK